MTCRAQRPAVPRGQDLGVSYARANALIGQLVDIGVLEVINAGSQPRRFSAPNVLEVLLS